MELIESLITPEIIEYCTPFIISFITFLIVSKCEVFGLNETIIKNKRVWWKILLSTLLVLGFLNFSWSMPMSISIIMLLLWSMFFPLPHEILLLFIIKKKPNFNPYLTRLIVTTPGILRSHLLPIKDENSNETQRKMYQYIHEIEKFQLFRWEFQRFYLKNLIVLLEIGAFKELKAKLQQYQKYQTNQHYMHLQICLTYMDFDYYNMQQLCKQLYAQKKVSLYTQCSAKINELCAAENMGNEELWNKEMREVEKWLNDEKRWTPELVHDLMLYYERNGLEAQIQQLVQLLTKKKWNNPEYHMKYKDILLQHYKVTRQYDRCQQLIMELKKYNDSKNLKIETKEIFNIRLMTLFFEFDLNWQEYSIMLFKNAEYYLSLSFKTGVEFIINTNKLLRFTQLIFKTTLNPEALKDLYSKIQARIPQLIQQIDEKIANTDDVFVYQICDLLMSKIELLEAQDFFKTNQDVSLEKRTKIHERLIDVCRRNQNIRQLLHFLNVYIDDILTTHKQIQEFIKTNPQCASDEDFIRLDEIWPALRRKAIAALEEMTMMIIPHNNDMTLVYYLLYAAYLHQEIGNNETSNDLLYKFESLKVDIIRFPLPTQKLYYDLKEEQMKSALGKLEE